MSAKGVLFLKKALGDDFLESLVKADLWKLGTATSVDPEEIHVALKIVPRTIMNLLISSMAGLEVGRPVQVRLPVFPEAILYATKFERDVYSGNIVQSGKVVSEFKNRTLPGIGLVVMTAFELYEVKDLEQQPDVNPETDDKIQRMIEDRLRLHDLINAVVDKRMAQQDAIRQLALIKLTHKMNEPTIAIAPPPPSMSPAIFKTEEKSKKVSPLGNFLEDRKKKLQKSEFAIKLAKGETIHCPDCAKAIFNETAFSGCLCFGDNRKNTVYIRKTEDGCKVSFPTTWDEENITMLLEILRKQNA